IARKVTHLRLALELRFESLEAHVGRRHAPEVLLGLAAAPRTAEGVRLGAEGITLRSADRADDWLDGGDATRAHADRCALLVGGSPDLHRPNRRAVASAPPLVAQRP